MKKLQILLFTAIFSTSLIAHHTKEYLIDLCTSHHIQYIEYCFIDFLGARKSIIRPIEFLDHDLEHGISFDGSSVPGCTRITNSDMLLMPDLESPARKIPWTYDHTSMVRVMCTMHINKETPYCSDPRAILQRELAELHTLGYDFVIGPEVEFYVFEQESNKNSLTPIDTDSYIDATNQIPLENSLITIVHVLNQLDLNIEKIHHEVGQGQFEISLKYDNALKIADALVTTKQALVSLFANYNKKVTFMPKPITGKPGNGMHLNFSLYNLTTLSNAFYDADDSLHLSSLAKSFIAGVLKHSREITLLLNPTINSYKRLGGHEAPKFICCGNLNRSALIRLPFCDDQSDHIRAEIRSTDASCNPYLACAALLKAGIEGIKNNYILPEVITENLYTINEEAIAEKNILTLPQSITEALEEFSHSKLMKELLGDFLFDTIVAYKKNELENFMHTVTDWELERYF